MKYIFLVIIRLYQRVRFSPFGHCRFYPSCSCYAAEAIEKHGASKGVYLAIKRLLACHPLGRSGFDPVPK